MVGPEQKILQMSNVVFANDTDESIVENGVELGGIFGNQAALGLSPTASTVERVVKDDA